MNNQIIDIIENALAWVSIIAVIYILVKPLIKKK